MTQISRKIFHVHELEELILNIHTSKAIHKFSEIPIKILMAFFTEIENNPKILCGTPKGPKPILRKKCKVGDITFPDFKLYYKVIAVKQYST